MIQANEIPFFIGTISAPEKTPGILRAAFDSETGKLSAPTLAAETTSPTFLATSPDGHFLYAAIEQKPGSLAAWRIEPDGHLAPLNKKSADGLGTCHVWVDGTQVIASNYSSGNVIVFPRQPDGSLGEPTASVAFSGSGPHPTRQQKPYAHGALRTPDGRFVYVCDLGTDQVWTFQFDAASGHLTPTAPPSGKVPAGGGPRHPALGIKGDVLYVNNEMGLTVSAFARNPDSGILRLLQTIPVLPEGTAIKNSTTSGIIIHPSGRWLYVSTRGHNSLTVFEILTDGTLRPIQNIASPVKRPREFSLDPSGRWLVVGGQDDGAIATMKVDPATGTLTPADRIDTDSIPVSFAFLGVPFAEPIMLTPRR
jgi:6-phosphogluconolactonase